MKKAKAQHVAKPAQPAKPPTPAVQKLQHQVAVLQRQVASLKHPAAGTAKHKTAAASKKHAVKRGWSPDEDVALCSARAVAESLRLALGVAVADEDVLALHWAAGGDRDAGASILAMLEAARQYGLAGCTPVFGEMLIQLSEDGDAFRRRELAEHVIDGATYCIEAVDPVADDPGDVIHGLILGIDWPQPHAVVAHDGAWWSWGEPCDPADFPGAVVEEAWAVTWQ